MVVKIHLSFIAQAILLKIVAKLATSTFYPVLNVHVCIHISCIPQYRFFKERELFSSEPVVEIGTVNILPQVFLGIPLD